MVLHDLGLIDFCPTHNMRLMRSAGTMSYAFSLCQRLSVSQLVCFSSFSCVTISDMSALMTYILSLYFQRLFIYLLSLYVHITVFIRLRSHICIKIVQCQNKWASACSWSLARIWNAVARRQPFRGMIFDFHEKKWVRLIGIFWKKCHQILIAHSRRNF